MPIYMKYAVVGADGNDTWCMLLLWLLLMMMHVDGECCCDDDT
jgi:hypothetical protein